MKKVKLLVVSLFVVLVSAAFTPAYAAVTGKVSRIFPAGSGAVHFRIHGDACNTGNDYYTFDMNEGAVNTTAAENWYTLLLSSAASGQEIVVRYVGDTDSASCETTGNKVITYIYADFPL